MAAQIQLQPVVRPFCSLVFMSVIVGGTDAGSTSSQEPRRPRMLPVFALAIFVALSLAVFPGSPSADQSASTSDLGEAVTSDSGRWIPVGTSLHDPFDARRVGNRYVWVIDGGIASIDATGESTAVSFPASDHVRRLTSNGSLAVAHGLDDRGPALWTSTDGMSWEKQRLPWTGWVREVAIRSEGLVVLGIDALRPREIVARELDQGWAVQATDAPDTGLWSTGEGFVGRGTLEDGSVGYLYSTDGIVWNDIGAHLSLHYGEVASLRYEDGDTMLVIPGSGDVLRLPEVPVVSLWTHDDRYWLQTQSAVWRSSDGSRWRSLPIDRDHGLEGGTPVLLPFSDRALLSVGGTRGEPRDVYVWILGS